MLTIKITSWEREKTTLLVETSAPRRNYSRIMEGGSNVDGDESGGTSPSRQGAGTGILVPRSLMAMAAEIGIASGEKGSRIRVSSTDVKYMPKGVTRGGQGSPGPPTARPRGGGAGRPPGAPVGPLRPSFGVLEGSGTLIFYIFFRNFS